MSEALSLPTLPSGVTGPSHIPDLTEAADIQVALKYLYYGSTGAANSANGIYGALSGLKSYVDASIAGINVHETVKYATTTTIAGTVTAGTTDASGGTGVGARITFSSTGVQSIDSGANLALNDRVLVKNGVTADSGVNSKANGIYYVSTAPAVGVAGVLTRAEDSNNSIAGEMGEGDFTFVSAGTTNGNTSWVLTSSSPTGTGPAGAIKIGTDPVTFIQFGSVDWGSQSTNTFFAAPANGSGTPTFRTLDYRDIYPAVPPSTLGQVVTYVNAGNNLGWTGPYLPVSGGTMTGNITLEAGTTSVAPLTLDTTGVVLTTPSVGAVEVTSDAVYVTNNPGTTSTGPGRGNILPKQMVFAQANSTASTNTTVSAFASTYDVLSVLEPAKLYRFRAKYFSSFTYAGSAGAMNLLFGFSNAPTTFRYTFKTYPQTPGTSNTQQGAASVTTAITVVPSQSTAGTWVTEIDGYFTTHATLTSTFTPQFAGTASNSSTYTIQTGSYLELEKLGSSTTAVVAGNWA